MSNSFKILNSFLCAKVQSIFIVPPPIFGWGPFVWSGDGTAGSVLLSRSYSIL